MRSLLGFGKKSMTTGDASSTHQFRVIYDFTAEHSRELSCKTGEFASSSQVTEQDGWIKVRISRRGVNGSNTISEGLVPKSYLEEIPVAKSVPIGRIHRPAPSAPSVPLATLAQEKAECTICYDELCSRPVAILLNSTQERVCRHFLHHSCAISLISSGLMSCPTCRTEFKSAYIVPDFDIDPIGWFECVDMDHSGSLSKIEVIEVLRALLPIDSSALESQIETFWKKWDKDGSGEIDFNEMCDSHDGLLVYVRSKFPKKIRSLIPPKLEMSTREDFFRYWDEDNSGTLEEEEIVRAIIKTFKLSESYLKVNEIRTIIRNVWGIFDLDNSGEIDLSEFVARDGLGEALCASIATFGKM